MVGKSCTSRFALCPRRRPTVTLTQDIILHIQHAQTLNRPPRPIRRARVTKTFNIAKRDLVQKQPVIFMVERCPPAIGILHAYNPERRIAHESRSRGGRVIRQKGENGCGRIIDIRVPRVMVFERPPTDGDVGLVDAPVIKKALLQAGIAEVLGWQVMFDVCHEI
ncbi:uncharacterized protein BO97DRAFT_141116 [Aspergillus homomorphus CBS 101889]|uniref:Uncharacterized protein n=1 Tax=Aspergillus homomorphus (strain CBS 101889) TaxID=1450537 RepID=A0A395HVS7_ASPHC|nr:hypothetical protein BO97DRAFT_141116 [Aspergillus homomorphus CBS 101889]RAL10324.1 hypothetical protein BO97DRAFT_141116 [Aspergillus homomorphus CBS 101889]